MTNVLEVRDLFFAYKERAVLNGISFSLRQGGCFLLFGPNGCGKTTLLDTILGIHKTRQGKVLLCGNEISTLSAAEKARKVSYVSQKSDHTFPYSVFQMVLMGRTAYSGMFASPDHNDEILADEAIRTVGMEQYRDTPFTKLSGGEMQLVKIARAIAQGTDLIILDEPTAHLDFRHELNVIQFITHIVKEKQISIVMATHFPNHALYFESCDLPVKVALMENGTFGAAGIPSEVLNEENMARIFGIRTKTYIDFDHKPPRRYIVPVEFTDEGACQWKK